MFSDWREGELQVMGGTFEFLAEVPSDVPEIRNPEVAEQLQRYLQQLQEAFPEVAEDRRTAFARRMVLEDNES